MAKNWSLSAKNLAMIGVLDDFYDAYCNIQKIYEKQKSLFYDEYGDNKRLWFTQWDKMSLKEVREVCSSLINKHLLIFSGDYEKVYVNAYAFQTFSFLNTEFIMGEGHVTIGYKSFTEFLIEFQIVVARVLQRWGAKEKPKYTLEQALKDVDLRISDMSTQKAEGRKLEIKTKPVTNEVLYIFDALSNTACSIKMHPVTAAVFVADLALGSGQIELPVHYCPVCERYFIGSKTLSLFEKNYGKLLVEKKVLHEDGDFDSFKQESKLHQLGYNVVDGNMSDQERMDLLIRLLESRSITYLDICSTLEQNIWLFRNSERHQLAVKKWEKDLKAIGEYVLNKEET